MFAEQSNTALAHRECNGRAEKKQAQITSAGKRKQGPKFWRNLGKINTQSGKGERVIGGGARQP